MSDYTVRFANGDDVLVKALSMADAESIASQEQRRSFNPPRGCHPECSCGAADVITVTGVYVTGEEP